MSIVRIGLAETKHFAEGYAAIFGSKKKQEKEEQEKEEQPKSEESSVKKTAKSTKKKGKK